MEHTYYYVECYYLEIPRFSKHSSCFSDVFDLQIAFRGKNHENILRRKKLIILLGILQDRSRMAFTEWCLCQICRIARTSL